jgi:transcription factor CON7
MSLVSTLHSSTFTNPLLPSTEVEDFDSEAALSQLLGAFTSEPNQNSMERGAPEYSQSGLHSPFSATFKEAKSEESPTDQSSVANSYTPEVRSSNNSNYSTSATPTSEYSVHPTSARSSSFPEHIQRPFYHSSNHSGSSGGMAQATSPSMPLQDGRSNHHNQIKSDADVPIDPSIAASSPTYPPHAAQYSPYPPQQDMSHGYPQHPGGPMYAQPRPDWAGYGQQPHHGMPSPYSQTTGVSTPTSTATAGTRPGQVSYLLCSYFSIYICTLYLYSVARSVTRSRYPRQ